MKVVNMLSSQNQEKFPSSVQPDKTIDLTAELFSSNDSPDGSVAESVNSSSNTTKKCPIFLNLVEVTL